MGRSLGSVEGTPGTEVAPRVTLNSDSPGMLWSPLVPVHSES